MLLRTLASTAWAALEPHKPDTNGVFKNYRPHELKALDRRYRKMFDLHADVHRTVFDEIAADDCGSLAEVACGSGYAVDFAVTRGLRYTGIDISETAIAVACLKETRGNFINLPVDQLSILKDRSFDAVYSSSMLEHIGFVELAIETMWRLASKRLDIFFYEGLFDTDENKISFHPHPAGISPKVAGGYYGVKVAGQSHGPPFARSGYFLNRFSQKAMMKIFLQLQDQRDVSIRHFMQDGKSRTVATIYRRAA
jgi:SAM-dependent methyltransferase